MYYVIMWDERCLHEVGTDGKDREESEHTTTFGTRKVNDSRGTHVLHWSLVKNE